MVFNTVSARAGELGGSATMLTEWGLCNPDSDHPDEAGDWSVVSTLWLLLSSGSVECHFVMDEADKHLQSWSYWDTAYGDILWDDDGNVIPEAVK